MEKKPRNKKPKASDGLITPQHIQEAQRGTMELGVQKMFNAIQVIEPELTSFIAVVAKDIAAHAMYEGRMSHPMATCLEQSIVALALNIFEAQHHAVYTYYKDIIQQTPVAALDAEPFPARPAEADEGGACASPQ